MQLYSRDSAAYRRDGDGRILLVGLGISSLEVAWIPALKIIITSYLFVLVTHVCTCILFVTIVTAVVY